MSTIDPAELAAIQAEVAQGIFRDSIRGAVQLWARATSPAEVAAELRRLADSLDPPMPSADEAREELHAAGLDPDRIAARGAELAHRLLATRRVLAFAERVEAWVTSYKAREAWETAMEGLEWQHRKPMLRWAAAAITEAARTNGRLPGEVHDGE